MKSDPGTLNSFSAKARARRMELFARRLQSLGIADARLLDIGGNLTYWRTHLPSVPDGLIKSIDVINLPPLERTTVDLGGVPVTIQAGDIVTGLGPGVSRYDVVYSNSVIEHVGPLSAQRSMAAQVMALGTWYWIQTPARSFPIEPHFYVPFFPYLPLDVRTFLHQRFDLGFMARNRDWLSARIDCEGTRLMTRAELRSLFIGCEIIDERFLGLCKSHIATNMPDGPC